MLRPVEWREANEDAALDGGKERESARTKVLSSSPFM